MPWFKTWRPEIKSMWMRIECLCGTHPRRFYLCTPCAVKPEVLISWTLGTRLGKASPERSTLSDFGYTDDDVYPKMYKILNDDTAPNLRNSFVRRNVEQTNYHLRNSATDLTLPKPKREFLKRSFKYSGAMLWNQLPNETKLAESIYSSNKYIKT